VKGLIKLLNENLDSLSAEEQNVLLMAIRVGLELQEPGHKISKEKLREILGPNLIKDEPGPDAGDFRNDMIRRG
jgi:hypothetical protein